MDRQRLGSGPYLRRRLYPIHRQSISLHRCCLAHWVHPAACIFFLLKIPASAVSCFLENLLVVSSVWQSAFKNYVFLKETNQNGSIVQSFVQFHAHVFLFSCNHIQIRRPTLNKIAYCSFRRVETKQDRRGLQRNYALNCSSIIFGNRRQNDLCLKNANCFVPEAESLVEAQLVDE